MTPDRAKAARDLLAFYAEAGVDATLGEHANDWLANPDVQPTSGSPAQEERGVLSAPARGSTPPSSTPGASARPAVQPAATPSLAVPPATEAAVMSAREAARGAATLDELRAVMDGFEGCALKATASRLVFADGNPEARLMFVGEAPGRDEDIQGLPFVGRSGQLLDRMLAAIGLDRTKVYIANIVPWRPPGNRTPTPVETQICLPFLMRQIQLVDPDVLVTLGNPSTQTLLQTSEGIKKMRGRWFKLDAGTREVRLMPTFHPAFLLRSPLEKRLAWRDFLAIKKALEETAPN
jgi:DNA polymerase